MTTKIKAVSSDVTGYETDFRYYATRYKQGQRTVYALDLSLDQVRSLIAKPDADKPTPGNRQIRANHAASFARYIRDHANWVAPAMLFRAPSIFTFEPITEVEGTEFGILSFPRSAAPDIQILDGQHRTLGFYLAEEGITTELEKARNTLAKARRLDPQGAEAREAKKRVDDLLAQRERLAKERISLQIFVEDDAAEYKQMFFDIADNALGITASVKARFDTRKVVNRALEDVLEHPLLKGRVDLEADRVGRGSPYLMGAKHVAEVIKATIVGHEGRVSRRQDLELKEASVAAQTRDFLDLITETFTPLRAVALGQLLPDDLRKTSLLGSVLMIRLLASVNYELRSEAHHWTRKMVADYFTALAKHMEAPVYEGSIWLEHVDEGVFIDGAHGPSGRRQDLKTLKNALVDWALDSAPWVYGPVPPRPLVDDELSLGDEVLERESLAYKIATE